MESLKVLKISNCSKLDTFPEIKGDTHCLYSLTLNSTGIREVPSSIGDLRGLKYLSSEGCEDLVSLPDSLCKKNLLHLSVKGCKKLTKFPENIGDLHFLRELNVSGRDISCLPKGLLSVEHLNVQFCWNLNELQGELLPNLKVLHADYHLALKSITDLAICCLKLCTLLISNYGAVSSEQVNVFLEHFRRTCIQCDFNQRNSFAISFPGARIPELFDYQFINQEKISIDLSPSWYTDKFMGFWISYGAIWLNLGLVPTLGCKSDPERKYYLAYPAPVHSSLEDPSTCCFYIPFERLWPYASGNKDGKNPNDYYMLELYQGDRREACWGIRLEYEKEAMTDIGHQNKRRKI